MKRLVLITLFSFGILCEGMAQSFLTQGSDTAAGIYTGPGDIVVYNKIKSSSSTDVYIKWKIISSHFDANWTTTGFCDNFLCQPGDSALLNGASHVSGAYSSAAFGDFHALFNGDNAAVGTYAYLRVSVDDTVTHYSRTLTFIAKKTTSGVNSITRSDDDIVIYPNPARESINVLFDGNANIKNITVYNLIGKAVSVFKVNGNSAKLTLDNIPSGIYFIRLQDNQGRTVATRKFTRQ